MTFSHDPKLNEIEKLVTNGERLSFEDGLALYVTTDLPGLGKLVVVNRKARMGRNPATGATIKIPAKKVLKFRIAKKAKDFILNLK